MINVLKESFLFRITEYKMYLKKVKQYYWFLECNLIRI